ncbi:DUF2332 domain-containing protein [Georgenia sp. Z1491]|uniref:DUF2332 domain-containing protein n=1 Tax=Georgenia sp. Z1491 TaxID=3416707 RepID=UPI003CF5E99F
MDRAGGRDSQTIADGYRLFARREARGVSPVYEAWSEAVAGDDEILDLLADLPRAERQPNLVLAAARFHGAAATVESFRRTVIERWDDVRETVLVRATQTNEAGRCAVLLPFLAQLPGPLALLEVGASAGLCLLPDRYSYRYGDDTLDPADGPSPVTIECDLGGITPPTTVPHVVWRAGIDLSPVDVEDDDARTWLETLVWPGQDERRHRLVSALEVARRDPPPVASGDLLDVLPDLAAGAPTEATLVVFHTAVLAYLSAEDRARFVDLVSDLPGRWISNEGNGVVHRVEVEPEAAGRFVLAVDGVPRALTDPHGRSAAALTG